MDLNVNTDKRITDTKYVSVSAANLETLWGIFAKLGIDLPIHSMEATIKFNGAILYWLDFISEEED